MARRSPLSVKLRGAPHWFPPSYHRDSWVPVSKNQPILCHPQVFCWQMWSILLPFCYRMTICSEAASVIHCSPIPGPLPTASTLLFSKTYLSLFAVPSMEALVDSAAPALLGLASGHYGYRAHCLCLGRRRVSGLNSPLLSSGLSTDPGGWTQGPRPPV